MSAFVSLRNSSSYWPSINHLAKYLHSPVLSAASNSILKHTTVTPKSNLPSEHKIGAFATANPFSLPGDVAVSLPMPTSFQNNPSELQADQHDFATQASVMATNPIGLDVQVSAVECPNSVRRDIQALFPKQAIDWPVTAVTIAQHTQNDMVVWSSAVADEREILTTQFISTATSICRALHAEGYFADFIDPSSGRPFLTQDYTPATLFETDPIQRHFGVEVKDLGCCKAVAHMLWGTKVFVGTLLTNAPVDSPVLKELLAPKECEISA